MISRLQAVFYWFCVLTWVRPIMLIVTSRDIQGREHIPREGALVLTSNHFSVGDPPILTGVFPRRIAWMAKQELFDIPAFGKLYNMGGCIPVRRFEGDLHALRLSHRALRRGLVLGMFPEGTRSGGRLGQGEHGSALIALRTGAPILPVAIWGTENAKLPRDLFRRTRVNIRYGKPFHLPAAQRITKEQVAAGTEEIMRQIAALLPSRYHGAQSADPTLQSVSGTAASEG
jgi:1-acyl-sn-glycerol-3-phosphate acyltransferase